MAAAKRCAAALGDQIGERLHLDGLLGGRDQPKMRLNGALVRMIRPSSSSVAMANGVSLKKREKRTSAARSASSVLGAAAAVEHQRARLAQFAVGEPGGAVQQAHREGGAVAARPGRCR